SEFRRGGFTERSSNSAPNAASSLCTCRVIAEGVRNKRPAAPAMDPAWANSTRARKSSSKGTSQANHRIVRKRQYHRDNNEFVECRFSLTKSKKQIHGKSHRRFALRCANTCKDAGFSSR